MKELDLGNSDFKSLMEGNNYFVDKSLFIRELIKSQKQVVLLPRPRRFGKTLNLSMLSCYFDVLQTENEKLFSGLKIWQAEEEIKEKRGKYPVIFISFKDVKATDWQKCSKLILSEITDLYRKNKYLLIGNTLDKEEKKEFNNILSKRADLSDFERSIKKLSEYLYRHHKQKVVILIDEYDAPIQAGYKYFYSEVVSFMKNLMSGAFKDNASLYKGVITGILRVSKESIFSGLNNISVYSVLDDHFSSQFGFTESEVLKIVEDFNITTDFSEIKKWYDGYKFGETEDLYNPWSILNYAVEFKSGFKTFWVNTSSDSLLKDRIVERSNEATRILLLRLVNGETIEKPIEENFVFPDFDTDRELLWTLLTFSGYLTVRKKVARKDYELAIPNYEVKTVFQDIILNWLTTEVKLERDTLKNTCRHLINNRIPDFEKGFKQIIGDTFSYYDIGGEPEKVYQSYVLGLLAILGDDYVIRSNRESGDGRYDILLIPHDRERYGIVIEIKQLKPVAKEAELDLCHRINDKLQEALDQINRNQYYKELMEHNVANIIKLPIVFVGKVPYITPNSIES